MMRNQISLVYKEAVRTFRGNKEEFQQNLQRLKACLDQTTAKDVHLRPEFMTTSLWERPGKAPVTYIDIYEDQHFDIGIFILSPGMKLPLHDHPHMNGLLKVLAGTIKISSLSLSTIQEAGLPVIAATDLIELVANDASESCVLEPLRNNLHEIEAVGGKPAAFLDVLAPPYRANVPGIGPRKCTYYKIVRETAPNTFRLEETDPDCFVDDAYPYTGPELGQA